MSIRILKTATATKNRFYVGLERLEGFGQMEKEEKVRTTASAKPGYGHGTWGPIKGNCPGRHKRRQKSNT